VGSFGVLDGGWMPDAALLFSGGLHDSYFIDECKCISNKTGSKDPDISLHTPSLDELFEILKYAIENSSIIGCFANNRKIEEKYGIWDAHQYRVAQVFRVNDKRVIKIQNPHNTEDKIKTYFLIF
jgi:hypothetical protein